MLKLLKKLKQEKEIRMKTKYLGNYYIEYFQNEDNEEESTPYLINEEDEDIYELELFMRHLEIIEGIGEIHGICGETNTSSIVLQFNESCDGGKLWRVW